MNYFEQTPSSVFFKGRPGDPRLGEWIRSVSSLDELSAIKDAVAILGFPDDTGVVLNRGRSGAKEGPNAIRKHLYKMACPTPGRWASRFRCVDLGNLVIDVNISETHKRARDWVRTVSERNVTVVILGGGHDFAGPCFSGFLSAQPESETAGLINVDPHLDVRPREEGKPHSGSSFRDILEEGRLSGRNLLQFGCRQNRNAADHWTYCQTQSVRMLELEKLKVDEIESEFKTEFNQLSAKCQTLGVSIDMDSCEQVFGVSAPTILGFSVRHLAYFAQTAGAQKKVKYFELAETAPELGLNEDSAIAAAEVLYAFLDSRGQINKN